MKLGTSLSKHGPGILPLQVHNPDWTLGLRPALYAWRVVGRRDQIDQGGQWIIDENTVGYLFGGHNWPALKEKLDKVPSGWAFVWPSITVAGGTISTGGKCSAGRKSAILPIFDEAYQPDGRFQLMAGPADEFQNMPLGGLGVTLAGTNENGQENLFLAADRRLVAPNRAGASELGTAVFDVTLAGAFDRLAAARLQSVWRVITPRGGPANFSTNVLAWQIGAVGCSDREDGWGMIYDSPKKIAAACSVELTGMLDVGTAADQHQIAWTQEREPVNSAHLATTSLLRGHGGDAPLEFQTTAYQPTQRAPFLVPVHLRHDAAQTHSHVTGNKRGLWRWQAECFFYVPTPGNQPIPTPPGCQPPPGVPCPPAGGDLPDGTGDAGKPTEDYRLPSLPDGVPGGGPPAPPPYGGVPAQGGQIGPTPIGGDGGVRVPPPDLPNGDPAPSGTSSPQDPGEPQRFPRFPNANGFGSGSEKDIPSTGRPFGRARTDGKPSSSPTGDPSTQPRSFPRFPDKPSRGTPLPPPPPPDPAGTGRIIPRFPNAPTRGTIAPLPPGVGIIPVGPTPGGAGPSGQRPGVTIQGQAPGGQTPQFPRLTSLYDPNMGVRPVAATTMMMLAPGMDFRPQAVVSVQEDLRYLICPPCDLVSQVDSETPVTVHAEAMGVEGGVTVSVSLVAGGGGGGG